ncbi:hypothetical protein J2Y83_004726 [Pseudomonas marginalis]|uniref:hypothetical protein n=1 Tax=Pseudomonas marginalis TaxID=298 RepID=UPI00209EA033|nr:hypothetical protein [Pseudomonas marginalis]MCP1508752.1 hypothetical protein [Pseudomonas marginalis]MCP1526257.1 hypothetical protein [Pseudomonas marginalis]MDQ0498430.1 hypothetical protein [Pseudomonas marginalis]
MDIFSSHLSFENTLLQTYLNTPEKNPPRPKTPSLGSTIDFSGERPPKKDNRSNGLDSLGSGNII